MSDVELLEKAGQALFGDYWQNPLTRAINDLDSGSTISERTMRRFVAGQSRISAWIWRDIQILIDRRTIEMGRVGELLVRMRAKTEKAEKAERDARA